MAIEPYIGEIMMWAGNYAPEGWAFCDGQLLSITQNTPLYALIGNTYGGNGVSNFALPDLRGRFPIGYGYGPGLTPRLWGMPGGAESQTVQLGTAQQVTQAETGQAVTVAVPPVQQTVQVSTIPPYLPVSFVIALQGYWPCRP